MISTLSVVSLAPEALLRLLTRYSTQAILAKRTLRSQLDEISEASRLKELSSNSERFEDWRDKTRRALEENFGKDSPLVRQFQVVTWATEKKYVKTLNAAEPVLRRAVASTEAVSPRRAHLQRNDFLLDAARGAPSALGARIWQLGRGIVRPLTGRKHKAKYLLNLRVAELDSGNFQSNDDPQYAGWNARCFSTLAHFFGEESAVVASFYAVIRMPADGQGNSFGGVLDQSRAVLLSGIEDVDELGIQGGFFENGLVRTILTAIIPVIITAILTR